MEHDHQKSKKRILRFAGVKDRTGLSHSTIYARIKDGEFPRPISLGARCVGWVESEIDDWIGEKVKSRGTQQ